MVEECYGHVGDLAETLALLLAQQTKDREPAESASLCAMVEEVLLPLRDLEADAEVRDRRDLVGARLGCVLCFQQTHNGQFSCGGVEDALVNRALAELAGVEPATMAHRLMGDWRPTAELYRHLLEADVLEDDPSQPFLFASHTRSMSHRPRHSGRSMTGRSNGSGMGSVQLIKRGREVLIWSRGEELVGEQFPEIVESACSWDGMCARR